MIETYNNSKELMEKVIKKMQAESKEQQQQLIIDSIIDIYNGKYRSYESYLKEMQRLNERIFQLNRESIKFNPEKTNCKYTQYMYGQIFDKKIFNYIKTKGEQDNG